MAYKKLDEQGLQTLITAIKTYVDNRADQTAEQRYRDTMREWFEANGSSTATPAQLTALCDKWYQLTRNEWDGYTRFYHPDKSAISEGTRGGDNARLTCKPSTNSTHGQDDFAGNPLFAPTDVNWLMDNSTKTALIQSIEGITCATAFTRTDPTRFVGVMQMTGYHWWTELSDNSDYYYEGYCATKKTNYAHIEPLPEAVLPAGITTSGRTLLEAAVSGKHGGVQQWVLHSKYMSDLTSSNTMTSYSGGPTRTYVFSHNTSHTYADNTSTAKSQTKTYSGATITDNAFLILMARIKYASLTMDGIIQGCVNYSFQYPVSKGETGVKRVLLTEAQANNVLVGSNMLIGNYTTTIDRGNEAAYSISGQGGYKVTSKTTVTINGVTYGAIYFDEAPSTFNTAANGASTSGTTYISSFIWRTGSCDDILGNDGSPTNCVNGAEPAKLQGIEYMMGAYEVFADVILNLFKEGDTYYYEPYVIRSVANQSTSITANYVATGLRIPQAASAGWYYIIYMGYKNGMYFAQRVGGSSTTYTRDAIYMASQSIYTREVSIYGIYDTKTGGGMYIIHTSLGTLGTTWYGFATLDITLFL